MPILAALVWCYPDAVLTLLIMSIIATSALLAIALAVLGAQRAGKAVARRVRWNSQARQGF